MPALQATRRLPAARSEDRADARPAHALDSKFAVKAADRDEPRKPNSLLRSEVRTSRSGSRSDLGDLGNLGNLGGPLGAAQSTPSGASMRRSLPHRNALRDEQHRAAPRYREPHKLSLTSEGPFTPLSRTPGSAISAISAISATL